jgi:hypothetical protein
LISIFVILACSPPVNITVSFGGKAWALSAAEITRPVTSGSGECQGAIAASESDSWNFGHGFLVRVGFFSLLCTIFSSFSLSSETCLHCIPRSTPLSWFRRIVYTRGRHRFVLFKFDSVRSSSYSVHLDRNAKFCRRLQYYTSW